METVGIKMCGAAALPFAKHSAVPYARPPNAEEHSIYRNEFISHIHLGDASGNAASRQTIAFTNNGECEIIGSQTASRFSCVCARKLCEEIWSGDTHRAVRMNN